MSNGDDLIRRLAIAVDKELARWQANSGKMYLSYMNLNLSPTVGLVIQPGAWYQPPGPYTAGTDPNGSLAIPIPTINTAIGTFTIPATGMYEVEAIASFRGSTAPRVGVRWLDNTGRGRYIIESHATTAATWTALATSLMVPFNAGQTVFLQVFAETTATNLAVASLRLVGPFGGVINSIPTV
ncbi:MAG: hypothetical protein E4H44_00320 [Candidatus Aminicenantes bacterium]|nr:MAG: hypothetical protein E4H44_00320 [Candidatus Aminicenantes bacterium]